ncbi:hypothetical protein BT63DRAFT_469870 [Microthyrium microscopicum]|uniref:Uncharacterized protein n=1 Tax=Microthyrium microscopicum TaxID=703497 RepID=A0A6A6UDD9_9PEZI|nr:hypothetical protein BT63DRAFT_469870 [Microthyrium microscopicum]
MENPYQIFDKARPVEAAEAREAVKAAKSFLLDYSFLTSDSNAKLSKRLEQRLTTRADSNQRLAERFGVSNAFTVRNKDSKQDFKSDVTKKMRAVLSLGPATTKKTDTGIEDWQPLILWAGQYAADALDHRAKCNLVEVVQFVTLKLSIKYIFKVDDHDWASQVEKSYVDFIASKAEPTNRPAWENQIGLHLALRNIIGGDAETDPMVPETNPMNYLLPTYETVWRVILRGLIEVLRSSGNATKWRESLQSCLITPLKGNERVWRTVENEESQIPPIDVIKEIMRLHPPTRRRREYYCQSKEDNIKLMERELGFMSFALICPSDDWASRAFGMKIICILVSVLCEKVKDEEAGWNLEPLDLLSRPLSAERTAFQNGELELSSDRK